MKRTLKEKIDYNKKRSDMFSMGYVMGVQAYKDYPKLSEKSKAEARQDIAQYSNWGKGKDRNNSVTSFSKGYMCGMRDAAAERKKTHK